MTPTPAHTPTPNTFPAAAPTHAAAGPNPLDRLRQEQRRVLAIGVGVTTMVAVWACWPLGSADIATPAPPQAVASNTNDRPSPLDLAAFSAPIWDPPPPPPPKVAQAPPPPPPPLPPPLKLQLLGIVRDDAGASPGALPAPRYIAAIYDEAADKLLMLKDGDRVGALQITRVTPDAVELADGAGPRRLALRQPGPPLPPLLLKLAASPRSTASPVPATGPGGAR